MNVSMVTPKSDGGLGKPDQEGDNQREINVEDFGDSLYFAVRSGRGDDVYHPLEMIPLGRFGSSG